MNVCGENARRAIGATLLIVMSATSWAADPNREKFREGKPPMGAMSPEEHREVRKMRRERAREKFEAADKDGDRALSREEAGRSTPRLNDNFNNVDANKDGKMTPDEIRAFRRERAKMRRIERGEADPRN